jgi:YHS domain-containing protein
MPRFHVGKEEPRMSNRSIPPLLSLVVVLLLALGTACKPTASPAPGPGDELVTDPVCGMQITPKTAAAKVVHEGKTYYFCDRDEVALFKKEPEKYLKGGPKGMGSSPAPSAPTTPPTSPSAPPAPSGGAK